MNNFTKTTSSLESLNVGRKIIIQDWLSTNVFYFQKCHYELLDNLAINYHRSIELFHEYVINGELPDFINFNIINGYFICSGCLTSLRGMPKYVKGHMQLITTNNAIEKINIKNICKIEGDIFIQNL